MLSHEIQSVLRQQGWSPERRVPITDWIAQLRSEGYVVSPEAETILQNFGGLTIVPVKQPDDVYGAGVIRFDPVLAASGEFDRVDFLQKQLGRTLTPLGEVGQGILLLADDGQVLDVWDNESAEYGNSFEDALQSTLLFARRKPVIRRLDSPGDLDIRQVS